MSGRFLTPFRLHIAGLLLVTTLAAEGAEHWFNSDPSGDVALYVPQSASGRIVLFVSGDGGDYESIADAVLRLVR